MLVLKLRGRQKRGLRSKPRRRQKTREVHVEKKVILVLVAIVGLFVVVLWTLFPQTASPPAPGETTQEKNTN